MLTDPPLEVHPRELQVLRGISYGLSNAAIGDRLHLSEHTVKTYLRRLFTNVGARDRTHAVRRGFELGLLAPQQTESRPPAIRITGNVEGLRPGTPRGPLSDQHIAACFAAEACWCRRGGGPR